MLKKKELLIILILAVLVTGVSLFYCVSGKGTIETGPLNFCGWPMSFVKFLALRGKISALFWKEFLFDFLFWFLILAGSWWVLKISKRKKIK